MTDSVLRLDAEGRAVGFEAWLVDLLRQLTGQLQDSHFRCLTISFTPVTSLLTSLSPSTPAFSTEASPLPRPCVKHIKVC
ncbi:hypothetical protein CLOP_g6869 [Closterium sp. NIES-67]|nr:hypothetical protein CLOP_g6869 [Closterium sp. NIES-67]